MFLECFIIEKNKAHTECSRERKKYIYIFVSYYVERTNKIDQLMKLTEFGF